MSKHALKTPETGRGLFVTRRAAKRSSNRPALRA